MPTLADVEHRALAALRPPPRLRLSAWIETNLQLPEGLSALPGQVRLWPYQHAIADAIGDPTIERVTLVKPVRVGFTTLLTGAIASYCANDPAPILALLPTESDCRDYVVSDLEPIFAASPAVRGLLEADQDEGARNTRRTSSWIRGWATELTPALGVNRAKCLTIQRSENGRCRRPAPRSPCLRGGASRPRGTSPRSGAGRSRRTPSPRRG